MSHRLVRVASIPAGAGLAWLLLSGTARAAIVEADVNASGASGSTGSTDAQFTYDPNISATDLINQGTATFLSQANTGTTSTGGAGGGTPDKLNDGAASGKTTSAGTNDLSHTTFYASGDLTGGPTTTFNLNLNPLTGGSATGYTLTSVRSIYGWQDTRTFADQKYVVSYATVANPTVFTTLRSVDYAPFASDVSGTDSPMASQVTLTDTTGALAANVSAIRFAFAQATSADGLTQNQSGQVIREIDVTGFATPEPGSLGLLGVAAVGLLRRRGARRA